MIGTSSRKIDDYDAIGFDMDLCLARYNMHTVLKSAYESVMMNLIIYKGYPNEMIPEDEDFDDFIAFSSRALVDLSNLNCLKIGKDGEVLRAYSGFNRLSPEKIKETYGSEGKIKEFPDIRNLKFGPNYYYANDLFKCDYIMVFIMFKQLLNTHPKGRFPVIENKTGHQILADLNSAAMDNYHHYKEKYNPPELIGYYYPMFKTNPKRFLYKTDRRVFEKLSELKNAGKVVFIVTNAHLGYYDITFPNTTQNYPEARSLFDIQVINAGKPKFFEKEDRPFYELDLSKKDLIGKETKEFREGEMLLEGNCWTLTEEIKKRTGKEEVRVLFFGDTPNNDLVCTNHPSWDCGFIFEELSHIDPSAVNQKEYFDFTKKWGSHVSDIAVDGSEVETLIYSIASTKFGRTFSRLSTPECLSFLSLSSQSKDSSGN